MSINNNGRIDSLKLIAIIVTIVTIILAAVALGLVVIRSMEIITVEGEISNIKSYIVKDGFGSSEEWDIFVNDNMTSFKAGSDTRPYILVIGDYVIVRCKKDGMYAKKIIIVEEA